MYRRARPIHWDEVVGQEHIKDVLRPALERGRIGQAYLFSGPRGVGKTTTARLIAMVLGCTGEGKPCGVCEACGLVISGRHPDVLEIDAASNNGVEDVRDLREKVVLQPMLARHKVFILDEAHMMSKSAFNALLKTLEEPPPHVVFVLATTEPERLPPTILSRCQHYRFRRLQVPEIASKLKRLAECEGVQAAPEALALIARSADGAMRDGESLLEQMIAAGTRELTLADVERVLGLPPAERVMGLARALAEGDAKVAFAEAGRLYADGFAPRTIIERAKVALRDLLYRSLGVEVEFEAEPVGSEAPSVEEGRLMVLIRALDAEDARFVRTSDLLALEMALTHALMAQVDATPRSGADLGAEFASRLSVLERQMRAHHQQSSQTTSEPPSVPTAPSSRVGREAFTDPPAQEGTAQVGTAQVGALPDFDPTSRIRPQGVDPDVVSRERRTESLPTEVRAAPEPSWDEVLRRADVRFKAILTPKSQRGQAEVVIRDRVITLTYKANFHAMQVASRFEEVLALVQSVFGNDAQLELVMPDGSKKNPAQPGQPRELNEPHALSQDRELGQPRHGVSAPSQLAEDGESVAVEALETIPNRSTKGNDDDDNDLPRTDPESISPFESVERSELALSEGMPFPFEEAPLELFDLVEQQGGADTSEVISIVQEHPNYPLLAKLFAHRIREAGKLEPQRDSNEGSSSP